MNDRDYMRIALEEAQIAARMGETPVGAVLVKDGEILARAHNLREHNKNALAHAEVLCIDEGCRRLGGWRLEGCELYVTLEPCPMCAGALIGARVARVVYGLKDPRAGCLGSLMEMERCPFPHKMRVEHGACAEEARTLLKEFFAARRRGAAERREES